MGRHEKNICACLRHPIRPVFERLSLKDFSVVSIVRGNRDLVFLVDCIKPSYGFYAEMSVLSNGALENIIRRLFHREN